MERNMKLAFVSDDHQTISAHFGLAKFYEVITLESGSITARETLVKTNPQIVIPGEIQSTESGHGHHHDHNAMIAPIADCEVLITRGMGKGAHRSLQENDIQPIITDLREIQAALDAYIAGTLSDHPELLH
jgi:predicted Fe-Mo cluster-binding NifX family protein